MLPPLDERAYRALLRICVAVLDPFPGDYPRPDVYTSTPDPTHIFVQSLTFLILFFLKQQQQQKQPQHHIDGF